MYDNLRQFTREPPEVVLCHQAVFIYYIIGLFKLVPRDKIEIDIGNLAVLIVLGGLKHKDAVLRRALQCPPQLGREIMRRILLVNAQPSLRL